MKKKQLFLAILLAVILAAVGTVSLIREGAFDRPEEGSVPLADTHLQFSEICTKNESILADNDGRYRDYVELYNGGEAFDLTGCRFTDGKVQSPPLEGILESGEYRLFFLSDDTTGFALGASGGDTLQLLSASGQVLVQATTANMTADQVMLAYKNSFTVSEEASPGFANDAEGLAAFRTGKEAADPKLVLSEILSENNAVLPDSLGRYSDLIELTNVSDEPLLLSDYYLSDSLRERFRYRLPAQTLLPGAYLLVWCDSENTVEEDGTIHANFALRHGDSVCITHRGGDYTAEPVTFPGEDLTMARGADGVFAAAAPSLGFANTEAGALQFTTSRLAPDPALTVSEVLLSSADIPYNGSFCDVIEIHNRSAEAVSTAGWYLSDGGDPLRCALPAGTLQPDERMVLVCGPTTTGFSLSREDTLRLRTPDGLWASVISCGSNETGSILCSGTGTDAVCADGAPSLGYPNTEEGELAYAAAALSPDLQISELMSVNKSYLKGAYGTTCDWIELRNASSEAIHLADYALTNNANDPNRYPLPAETLEPGASRVILLSETTENLPSGYPVLPCTLSSRGETLYLAKQGAVADYVSIPALAADVSYGRPVDSALFSTLAEPTPGRDNSAAAEISEPVVALTPQGVYPAGTMTVSLSAPGEIYYTTNCTAPDRNDTLYTGPITISETTVLRVIVYEEGKRPSAVTDLTYLVGEDDSLPVVSLVSEPSGLFDPTYGMYMEGPNAAPESPHVGANYWMDWEKKASVSLFEKDGTGFSEPCGLKIFGGFSRALYMKSFSVYFRSVYGASSLDYPLFGEEGLDSYECFILRSSGQDLLGARMRDVLATSLISEYTNIAVQKYRPVVVYINGRFWGVYYIREKINENYIAGNYNTTPDQVDLTVADGLSSADYSSLIQYVRSHDLSKQEHYDYVCSQMDVVNYMDYIIGEIWIANGDNGNIKFFRIPGMKWTWIMYDTDWGFTGPSIDTVSEHLNPWGTGSGDAFSTSLINGLFENDGFREEFLRRFAWQMNTIWTEENILARVDELVALLEHDLVKDYQRWNRSYNDWLNDVEQVRTFARERHSKVVVYIQNYFHLTDAQMREYGFPV